MAREQRPRKITITRYVDADGRRCTKSTPGARKVKEQSETFWANMRVEGKWTRVNLETTDEGAAWVELRRLQKLEREREAGLSSPMLEHARKPLTRHVEDWRAVLTASGITAKQVKALCGDVTRLASIAKWTRLGNITRDSARLALAELQAGSRSPNRPNRGNQTRNHYLSHLRQFCIWCVEGQRLLSNPIEGLKPIDVETDKRHHRRCPADAEAALLLRHLEEDVIPFRPAKVRRGMSPKQRALGYQVAMATGLRANELRSLTRESFDLISTPARLTCSAAYDKRRKTATITLPDWLAEELRAWFESGGGCWSAFHHDKAGLTLQQDLAAIGIPYATPGPSGEPLYFDMHALRHWYCTQVGLQPGMDLATLLRLTRHSTPELALKRYAHADQRRVDAAAARVPRPGRPNTADHPASPDNQGDASPG